MKKLVLFCIIGVAVVLSDASEDDLVVDAPTGRIRGSVIKSRLGKDIFSFRGVRYAEPPVGQQRFQPPIPALHWDNVFDATEEGPSCPRLDGTPGNISEDCLRLNVYTTKLPASHDDHETKRPVVVFIHPGALYLFSGQSYYFGPQYLLDKDVVLVTINYRLATLGFFSTGDSLAPGNLGLKDQVIALRWIQKNIASFGGDPNCVTIAGYSIGSISVMLHMVSPMSKNLFHRAMAMSGGIVMNDEYPHDQKNLAKKQAELLGCPTDTTGSMLICLNSKPVENFTNTIAEFFEFHGDPLFVWKPVVEPEVRGVERFLPDQPANLIRQKKFHHVPLIISTTRDEFAGNIKIIFERAALQGNNTLLNEINANFYKLAPIIYDYERKEPRSSEITNALKQFYLNGQPASMENIQGLGNLYADDYIIAPTHRSAVLFADHCKQPVYLAKFTYEGRYSFVMWNDTTAYGINHHDDLQYVFYISTEIPYFQEDAPEISMVEKMTSIWYNFAKTGEPIPENDEKFKDVTWDRFNSSEDNYLDLNMHPTMKSGFFSDRMPIWERLFPLQSDHHHHHYHHDHFDKSHRKQ